MVTNHVKVDDVLNYKNVETITKQEKLVSVLFTVKHLPNYIHGNVYNHLRLLTFKHRKEPDWRLAVALIKKYDYMSRTMTQEEIERTLKIEYVPPLTGDVKEIQASIFENVNDKFTFY